jgi:hypothetical protein
MRQAGIASVRLALPIALVTLLAACSAGGASGQTPGAAAVTTFSNSQFGYSLNIPPSWHEVSTLSSPAREVLSNEGASDLALFSLNDVGPYGEFIGSDLPAGAEIAVVYSNYFYPFGYCETESPPPPLPTATVSVLGSRTSIWVNPSRGLASTFETVGVEAIAGPLHCYGMWFGFGSNNGAGDLSAQFRAANLNLVESVVRSFGVTPVAPPRATIPTKWTQFADSAEGYSASYPSDWSQLPAITASWVGTPGDIQQFSNSPEVVSAGTPIGNPAHTGEYMDVWLTSDQSRCAAPKLPIAATGSQQPHFSASQVPIDGQLEWVMVADSSASNQGTGIDILLPHANRCYSVNLWFGSSVAQAVIARVLAGVEARFHFVSNAIAPS